MNEICKLIPALANEIEWDGRGKITKTTRTKDEVAYSFKNGSIIKNAAIAEGTRGARFQSLLTEEVAKVDQEKYTEIIVPTLTVSRKVGKGDADPNEILNQSAVYVTSAGFKDTYAYQKLIDVLCHMVADTTNHDAFVIGGDWRIPVIEGLQPKNFIESQETDSSMDEAGFDREYNSIWGGVADGAFFNPDQFDRNRVLEHAETGFNKKLPANGYYVMGVDVGRHNDLTEIVILKVLPDGRGFSKKHVVNIITFEGEHLEKQAIKIKKVFQRYKCDMCVLDGNGVGDGLVDLLVRDQIDPDTGDFLANWGVYNDEDGKYKEWQTSDTIHNALYVVKANLPLNSELYSYCQVQLSSNHISFLVDETVAKNNLLASGKKMSTLEREEYLRPYVETTFLKSQMMNMVSTNEGANIKLTQSTKKIKKDKLSALIYALLWVKRQDERNKNKKKFKMSDYLLFG